MVRGGRQLGFWDFYYFFLGQFFLSAGRIFSDQKFWVFRFFFSLHRILSTLLVLFLFLFCWFIKSFRLFLCTPADFLHQKKKRKRKQRPKQREASSLSLFTDHSSKGPWRPHLKGLVPSYWREEIWIKARRGPWIGAQRGWVPSHWREQIWTQRRPLAHSNLNRRPPSQACRCRWPATAR